MYKLLIFIVGFTIASSCKNDTTAKQDEVAGQEQTATIPENAQPGDVFDNGDGTTSKVNSDGTVSG